MNAITHFELPVNEASRGFYEKIFGWKVQEMADMDYTMVYTTEVDEKYMPVNVGSINGGLVSIESNGGTNPVLVIDVNSIDDYLKKVQASGGTIVSPKMNVGDMGYYAKFKDPAGVVMGIWETVKKAN